MLVLLAVFGAMLAVASPAGAAGSCGRAVIDDWYDNGRVDGTYALHCYDDAINTLPRDVRDYSSAKDDIQRALQKRKRGEPAPPASTDPTPATEVRRRRIPMIRAGPVPIRPDRLRPVVRTTRRAATRRAARSTRTPTAPAPFRSRS